ncbi:MAG: phosphonopyruvate decarboxylase [Nanoarchaeota archaeon]|mgnify:CR=1 FL=1
MISCKKFYDVLASIDIEFFTGVPDSLLRDFCAYVADNTSSSNNIIAANEGNAVALAAGHYLATGKFGLVYMQNSGFGNAINPLTSLADEDVYSIPMVILIGWRGEPGLQDEPQHTKMGKITLEMLENIGIPYKILDDNFESTISEAKEYMEHKKAPYAIVVRRNTFEEYKLKNKKGTSYELNREEALKIIVPLLNEKDIIVSTTGKISRELYELREINGQGHSKDFLTVGCMGHSSSIALSIALAKPRRQVYCFDGDGALIMHMGALSVIGQLKPDNLKQVVFNNFAHDSVGGQPTAASNIDIPSIAKGNGYADAFTVATATELQSKLNIMKKLKGPVLMEIRINKGSRENLGRPAIKPTDNKEDFIKFVRK